MGREQKMVQLATDEREYLRRLVRLRKEFYAKGYQSTDSAEGRS